ncbi:D-alanyl-D-alanine carboxypeptidase family protein [Paenochrobactrum sp. BZR 201-1]|uniref:D-alanyl-D-alanine carboxypeptidase family protein n=1 Tax=Paenochrobactrum sp. BZR 201-1 TaxID=3378075 RepID=UPI003854C4C1
MPLSCVSVKRHQPFKLVLRKLPCAILKASLLIATLSAAQPAFAAADLQLKAPQILLLDDKTGTVLFSRNIDQKFLPASLAKLMTAEVVFDALNKQEISLQDSYVVSEHAWRTGGAPSRTSTMFAKIKSLPIVEDLVQGMIVQMANDACIILAEGITGDEQKFVERMNERAQNIGLKNSVFVNSTGLPDEGQHVTVADLTLLARHIYHQYPQYYPYYAQTDFTWNKIFQRNRNPLLYMDINADGMSIGGTTETGFALVTSAEKNGRRLFLSLAGLKNEKDRSEEARQLIEWGMNNFDDVRLFNKDTIIGQGQVFNGAQSSVPLVVKDNVDLLLPKDGRSGLSAEITYRGPLNAPVKADEMVGTLKVKSGEHIVRELPVFTQNTVALGNLEERSLGALIEIATGWIRKLL